VGVNIWISYTCYFVFT